MEKTTTLARIRRLTTVSLLGFSSGLPLVLVAGSLQAWYTSAGVDIVTIGFLSFIQFPYMLKFIWAPLLDSFALPFLTRRRGWILTMQIIIATSILVMAMLNPAGSPKLLAIVALLVSIFSATQDIAIDAYRTELLHREERGLGAACYIAGYRIAMVVAGGIGLILAQYMGWKSTYILMALLMVIGIFATLMSFEVKPKTQLSHSLWITIKASILEFFKRNNAIEKAIALLLLVLLYKLGEAFAQTLTTPFLLRGLGFTLAEVGIINKIMAISATIIGALLGGFLMLRIGLYRSLMIFGILQAVSNLLFMMLAVVGKSIMVTVIAVFTENLCSGMATAAFLALLMALCNQQYTATQFALLSALASVGRISLGPIAGVVVEYLGWAQFYFWTFIVSLPGLFLLWFLRNETCFHEAYSADEVEIYPSQFDSRRGGQASE